MRCPVCDELRGRALFPDPPLYETFSEATALCWCDGLVCAACGRGRIHKPISDYVDKRSGHLIHVAYFMGATPCSKCGKTAWREARSAP